MGGWLVPNGYRASVGEDEKVLEMGGDGCIVMGMYLESRMCRLKNG